LLLPQSLLTNHGIDSNPSTAPNAAAAISHRRAAKTVDVSHPACAIGRYHAEDSERGQGFDDPQIYQNP
jgi:hypothetical protein